MVSAQDANAASEIICGRRARSSDPRRVSATRPVSSHAHGSAVGKETSQSCTHKAAPFRGGTGAASPAS
eukprot:889650-Pleurochrysis_carterae.AAC.3